MTSTLVDGIQDRLLLYDAIYSYLECKSLPSKVDNIFSFPFILFESNGIFPFDKGLIHLTRQLIDP